MSLPLGGRQRLRSPGDGRKPCAAVLGIDAEFDGHWCTCRGRHDREPLAGGDAKLLGDKIVSGHHLGHRMLDLDARIHLDEEKTCARRVVDELDGAGIDVFKRANERERRVRHGAAHCVVEHRRGRLLDKLLMPALHAAIAFAELRVIAVRVAEDLDFDMADLREEPFKIDVRPPKGGFSLGGGLIE